MKVKRIDLDDQEMPETIQVEMTHDEATFLASLLGKQNGHDANAVLPGGDRLNTAVYEGLTFGVFNRFYEDGVDGAVENVRSRPS